MKRTDRPNEWLIKFIKYRHRLARINGGILPYGSRRAYFSVYNELLKRGYESKFIDNLEFKKGEQE